MTDFSPENASAPNGPAPFPPVAPRPERPEEPKFPKDPAPLGSPLGGGGPAAAPNGGSRLAEVKGRIEVADEVVEKVAGLAAMQVKGVADLGGDIERTIESVRERIGIGNKRGDQGIKARITGREVTVDVTIMIEYGNVVMDVARHVKNNVANQTARMLGLNVVEVNVTVDDVRLPRQAKADEAEADGRLTIEG